MAKCTGTVTRRRIQCNYKAKNDDRCNKHRKSGENICNFLNENGIICGSDISKNLTRCYSHYEDSRCKAKTKNEVSCDKIVHEKDKTFCKFHEEKEVILIEHEKDSCPECKTSETWRWMKDFGFTYYEISSLGKVYSYKRNLFMDINPDPSDYVNTNLINDDGKTKRKSVHTWQGVVFFGLPMENKGITIDHIDRIKTHNRVCCNLRRATRSEQCLNKEKRKFMRGRAVLQLSPNGDLVRKYVSSIEASDKLDFCDVRQMRHLCQNESEYMGFIWRYEQKEDYGNIKWKSSTKEFPNLPPFEASEKGDIFLSCGRITKGHLRNLYYRVNMGGKMLSVDILICTIYHGPKPSEKHQVSHLDTDSTNNSASNLSWMIRRDNMLVTHKKQKEEMDRKYKPTRHVEIEKGTNKSIRMIRIDGTYTDFSSAVEAEKLVPRVKSTNIRMAARGKTKWSGKDENGNKLKWEFIENPESTIL
uniref:HNH endonuclease n=1 Tax=Pithovirus LCPAC403 TaxID=2506596 RepID=A0A481ZC10_9VIRU|nr:MAG: HNH endonuclease [Pithovirus LCPAC403]